MSFKISQKLMQGVTGWLLCNTQPIRSLPLSDFERICYEIRPCDVLLIEGRSRVSEVIRAITQSPWTHAALYIGRLHDIEDVELRKKVAHYYQGDPADQLLIESVLGQGTIISPITAYRTEHIRICRPKGLSRADSQKVISFAINRFGVAYDVRQIVDLFRFLFPWQLWPRRWRSSLFRHNAGAPTHDSCSSLVAEAFTSVHFPILPVLIKDEESGLELIQRNTRLYTPSDFDYSPFFEIIKYPIFEFSHAAPYRKLPWKEGIISNDHGELYRTSETEAHPVSATELKEIKDVPLPAEEMVPQEKISKRKKKPLSRIWDFFD